MKKKVLVGFCMVFAAVACCTMGVEAAGKNRQKAYETSQKNNGYYCTVCDSSYNLCNYNNCSCDEYIDENSDGICDNCADKKYTNKNSDNTCSRNSSGCLNGENSCQHNRLHGGHCQK